MSGDSVALLFSNSVTQIICFLALSRMGSVIVPINTDLKKTEISQALRESGCRVLLASHHQSTLLDKLIQVGLIEAGIIVGRNQFRFHGNLNTSSRIRIFHPRSFPESATSDDQPLLELKTSGTTGKPKRIQRTHGQLHWLAESYVRTINLLSTDRILAVIPLSHGHGLCSTLLASLSSGASLYLQEKFHRRQTLNILARQSITVFPAVPFIYSILAETTMADPINLSQLRLAITGGAPLTERVWHHASSRLGLKLRQSYGSTETGAVTVNIDPDPESSIHSVGTPLDGIELTTQNDVLAVRSPAAAKWSISAESDSSPQVRTPLFDENGWTLMGDTASIDFEGRLTVTGRISGVINVAGRKVYSEEVEAFLLTHSRVQDAVVVPVRDSHDVECVKAKIVVNEPFDQSELIAYCREFLADYKIPRIIEIESAIPRNHMGKVDRTNLDTSDQKVA
jgi:long-chain acyl-CoA synthetase